RCPWCDFSDHRQDRHLRYETMPTCAEVLAATLRDAGVERMFGLPRAWRRTLEPRFGPVHLALPSDVARLPDRQAEDPATVRLAPDPAPEAGDASIARIADEIARAARPVLILGRDLNPSADAAPLRRFVEAAGAPVFVTPKAKGIFPEDHPLFQVAQQRRGHADYGVRYGAVDFAGASAALGAWSRRVSSLDELEEAVKEAGLADRPAVIEVPIDPTIRGSAPDR